MPARSHRRRHRHDQEQWILVIALKRQHLAVRGLNFLDFQIGVQFDAHIARNFQRLEVHFGGRRDSLPNGIQRCGNIVIFRDKSYRTRLLRP